MGCDGPEDCGPGTECCWFEGQGSRCIAGGNCGFTGALSAVMCHSSAECFSFPTCCPVTPSGLPSPLYATCTFNRCP
jgi:hypothetical protein